MTLCRFLSPTVPFCEQTAVLESHSYTWGVASLNSELSHKLTLGWDGIPYHGMDPLLDELALSPVR